MKSGFKRFSEDQNPIKPEKNKYNKITLFSIILIVILLVSNYIWIYHQQTQLNQLNEKFNVYESRINEINTEKNEIKKEISRLFDSNQTDNFWIKHSINSKLRFKRDYEESNESNQNISQVSKEVSKIFYNLLRCIFSMELFKLVI
jgi:predicted negative regulator of RcsB-dependent stress response